jgi:hypothetical protein
MSTSYKTLGQITSTGTISTYDILYSVPLGKSAIVSNIVVCNRSSSSQTFRIACSASSSSVLSKEFISFGISVPANDSIPLVMGITLDSTIKFLMCSSSSSSMSFSAFGAEIS